MGCGASGGEGNTTVTSTSTPAAAAGSRRSSRGPLYADDVISTVVSARSDGNGELRRFVPVEMCESAPPTVSPVPDILSVSLVPLPREKQQIRAGPERNVAPADAPRRKSEISFQCTE